MLHKVRRFEKLIFSFGVLIGVVLACLLVNSENETAMQTSCEIQSNADTSYSRWLAMQNIKKYPVDYEESSYGNTKRYNTVSEAAFLYNAVHVYCVVFVTKRRNALAVKNTWGNRCNEITFIGLSNISDISVITFKPKSSWQYLCDTMRYIWQHNKGPLHWVIFLPDDVFVIPENLRYYVAALDYNEPHYLGHDVTFWGKVYNVGEAGYVLSKGALLALQYRFNTSESCLKSGKYWKNEDFYLGKYLAEMGITPEDTKDNSGCNRFHRYNLNYVMGPHSNKGNSPTRRITNQINPGCYSKHIITFNGIEPDKLYLYEYLLYRVKVLQHGGTLGNQPPAMLKSEDEVWREFVREEGLGYLEDISPKRYFELWQRKIPSPEMLNDLLRQQSQNEFNNDASGPES
ncbi:hypothetical protein ANN_07036 [Periplaneta americana]|uniref:Glycoprotein-N-acetylgalactosamine 3-beta-galactosyltransferase 1 n=1 Tax=Periplaneta americana TaxID=6978 RepID=A0ABQ8THC4_PERAM|nr:hypothetical protein ANN_07036 [Periplaneta americana]